MPLAFYVYSIAYGSVPIFIPQLWPHSYYNARYGMEMLPALALFACVAAAATELRMKQASDGRARWMYAVVLAFVVLNPVGMIYGTDLVQKCASLIERHPSNQIGRASC